MSDRDGKHVSSNDITSNNVSQANSEQFDDEFFDAFLDAVPEHTPPQHVKGQLLARLGHSDAGAALDDHTQRESAVEAHNVVSLRAKASSATAQSAMAQSATPQSAASRKSVPRKTWVLAGGLAAAALLVVVTVLTPVLDNATDGAGEGTIVAEDADSTAAGHEQMHEIMSAADLVSGATSAEGARLHIVSSTEMGKAGAMVDGQPDLADGMGAQVWSVDKNGVVRSAGVIGQDPHEDVWMPFDAATHKVMVTEEPAAGSTSPSGRMLAEVVLEA
ncbi:MAG: anti-sigma factor [Corynebacterium propinquum]|uniref:anti-sigma factor n=1 Tax=Corynebacterium propinquum TaxID=43769 RepID=UPI000DB001B5|nr:anti-sigma factor [Corynebacterium propinquum]MDK4319051.1 anti-sigma factor [Corynebacterium propinquum]PZQ25289.1 MAG: anti-sigma factor [Corynebacterium propinquum]